MKWRVAFLLCLGTVAFAADVQNGNFGAASSSSQSPKTKGEKRTTYPFSGELEAHDKQTLTLKGKKKPRVLLLTPDTRFVRDGSPAKLADAIPGERVSGSARKNAEGQEEAVKVNLKGSETAKK